MAMQKDVSRKSHQENGKSTERTNRLPEEQAQGIVKILVIEAPKMECVSLLIRGTSPYCQNRMSAKAIQMMKDAQEAGSVGKKGKKREPKDFKQCYEQAKHVSDEGWLGIPCMAFKNAMVSACRLTGFAMTRSKLAVFVEADGNDVVDMCPLVRITKGKPRYVEHPVRNASGVADIRARPMWAPGWEAVITVRYDADQFSTQDVLNLLQRVGMQVGVGEGRADSKESCGQGWGFFEVIEVLNKEKIDETSAR